MIRHLMHFNIATGARARVGVLRWLRDRYRQSGTTVRELDEPFLADILLDGAPVAILTDRTVVQGSWTSYRIEPVGDSMAIYDDDLWKKSRLTFRDPLTGELCTSGFVGGTAPFVRDGRVLLRALYFGLVPAASRATRR
jgi:hypothetical protein